MSITDAIVLGEGWISEHYFTTDAKSQSFQAKVLERRKMWDEEAARHRPTVRSRFTEARSRLEVDLGSLGEHIGDATAQETADDVHERIITVLGLDAHGLQVARTGRVLRVSAPGISHGAPLAVVLGSPVATVEELLAKDGETLPEPVVLADEAEFNSAARLVSALFVSDDAPELVLVTAGRWLLLAERERWAEGRYLAVDIQLVCERNDTKRGGEVDRALACFAAESIAPDADGDIWWHDVLDESVKHTVGVSQDLRDGVRLSIEILANEVVTRRRQLGLDPLPPEQAQPLAKQSLRFLYRILFLLYAEASPELGVLPIGAPEYAQGYSLDRLRDLVQVELATPQAISGTHLYDSLRVLFRLVDRGHLPDRPTDQADDGSIFGEGLTFNPLRADLFRPEATAHIDAVGLGNLALQEVLAHLLLSKEARGRDRGFISYAELGINQLGAVYEGLMSYTGFFAETDLYEVAKAGDASKGSWVVPVDRAEGISADDFVRAPDAYTGELKPVLHARGTFVFRLAGRERQQSASYYTPEVLTRFTVGQALEELLDQHGTTPAADILSLTVCEPALGSGAFAIEAVRQLAEQYLQRRQKELGARIDPDEYPRRLQEVKAYLALHNVYGVDLNATAVELAEISLWLDTMVEGLDAPWFGLHLRRGNSLIGARRAVFSRNQVATKAYLKDVPRDVPMESLARDIEDGTLATDVGGSVHHFLLPSSGWGSAVDAKEAKELAPENLVALKTWRSAIQTKPTKSQVDALVDLSYRVESLWHIALQRLEIAETEIRRAIPVWGAEALPSGGAVQREQIEEALADARGAYQRLRRVMDAWCALWFWPLTDALTTQFLGGQVQRTLPPSLAEWIDALQMLLGRHSGRRSTPKGGNQTLTAGATWDELGDFETNDLGFASAMPINAVLDKHPWLRVCEAIAAQQGFFHWALDFAKVFASGGFALQLGNPPWVRPIADVDALLAEGDPWWQLALKPTESVRKAKRLETLALPGIVELLVDGTAEVSATSAFVGSSQLYPHLVRLQPDLYRCFMERTWCHSSHVGVIGLIHPESHFTDEKAGRLRSSTYERLRRHWQFANELHLFEIGNLVTFGVHVYGTRRPSVRFIQATSLYHPDTADRSLLHDGSGTQPGLKTSDGHWDLRPHSGRLSEVTDATLGIWHSVLEDAGVPVRESRMVYTVNNSSAEVLGQLAKSPRIGELPLKFSSGWHEKSDRTRGYFTSSWGRPRSWADVILQGPHLYVATPIYKTPNRTMLSHRDWSAADLESLASDAVPVTSYKPAGSRVKYDGAFTNWGDKNNPKAARDFYRVAWRRMANNTGERTLIPALIPPGTAHVHGVGSAGFIDQNDKVLVVLAGFMSSLIADFLVRAAPKSDVNFGAISRLPFAPEHPLSPLLMLRSLRLNAVTERYGALWASCYSPTLEEDEWAGGFEHELHAPLSPVGARWTYESPLRIAADRRQALVEIDALVALAVGISADELCTIYRTQFPVLYGYDCNDRYFDRNGRMVPSVVLAAWRKTGDGLGQQERTATNASGFTYEYELPFVTLDRETDMREAYAHFEGILKDRT